MPHDLREGEFLVSDRRELLDLGVAHAFIGRSYLAQAIPRDLFERSVANSIPFGVYHQQGGADGPRQQVGFARIISDKATYAYLADVFVDEAWRGRGLAKTLVRHIRAHPDIAGVRRVALITRDTQTLYAQLGFMHMPDPSKYMEWRWNRSYAQPS